MCQKISTAESDPSFSVEVSFSLKAANTIFCEKWHHNNPHSTKHQQQHKMVKSKAAGKVTLGVLSQGKQNKRSKQGAGTGLSSGLFLRRGNHEALQRLWCSSSSPGAVGTNDPGHGARLLLWPWPELCTGACPLAFRQLHLNLHLSLPAAHSDNSHGPNRIRLVPLEGSSFSVQTACTSAAACISKQPHCPSTSPMVEYPGPSTAPPGREGQWKGRCSCWCPEPLL